MYVYSQSSAIYHNDVVDENGNVMDGFKTASDFKEIEFGSTVSGSKNYWTRGEDDKPVLLPQN